jgi:hypothetical protein
VVAIGVLLLDALWNRRLAFLAVAPGLFLGRLPATLHDLDAGGAATEVVTRYARGAGGGLPFSDQLIETLTWAFPVVFGGLSGETSLPASSRGLIGALFLALVVWFGASRAPGLLKGLAERRIGPALLPLAHFGAALVLVWLVAGEGQYTRPRYFLPLLGGFAMMFGAALAGVFARSRALGVAAALLVLGWNVVSNLPRLREGVEADRELRALAASLEVLDLRTGYSDFPLAGPISMVTRERVTVVGLLGPTTGEHLARQIDLVADQGPDFFLTRPEEEPLLARRLGNLGVRFRTYGTSVRIFHELSRRVSIDEVAGFREEP